MAQEKRQGMEHETALADIQREVVKAQQSVKIAQRTADAVVKKSEGEARSLTLQVGAESEATKIRVAANAEARRRQAGADAEVTKLTADADAERIAKTGTAEAESILAIGRSTAEAYELQVRAMGDENFTPFKITEEIGRGNIRVIPDIVINAGATAPTAP